MREHCPQVLLQKKGEGLLVEPIRLFLLGLYTAKCEKNKSELSGREVDRE